MAKKSAFADQFGTTELPMIHKKEVRKKPKMEKMKAMYCTEGTGPQDVMYGMMGEMMKKKKPKKPSKKKMAY